MIAPSKHIFMAVFISIPSDNFLDSINFYRMLGFEITTDLEMADGSRKTYMNNQDMQSVFIEFVPNKNISASNFRFTIKNVNRIIDNIKNIDSIKFNASETPYAIFLQLTDPFGTEINLTEFFVEE
jgi:hypothetical protein